MERNQRVAIAQETLRIVEERRYTVDGEIVDIADELSHTEKKSFFISQEEADHIEKGFATKEFTGHIELRNESTLDSILRLYNKEERPLGVLNFASAKNPGGGFLNGALAQEESLAIASGLYASQLNHAAYYNKNRACRSMMYTDCAIWSQEVVFFRNSVMKLLQRPVTASVLTLPAVNFGQVLLKNENVENARATMKRRMKISLAVFADRRCDTVVLGAYGCGVFRNNPIDVAGWWDDLLSEYGGYFRNVVFAVLDRSATGEVFSAFSKKFAIS
jgi:uncharacterized protein (TIGR02452 family)